MTDSDAHPMPSLVGKTVGARYEVKSKLGEGGMGAVYSAVDTQTQSKVALKVLLESLATDPKAVRRFEKEAMAVSRVSHPNIVSMVDYGKSEEGLLYIAMEHLDGLTLFDLLVKERCMTWERSLSIVRGIARALAAAHGAGVIHRDLKPDNVMLVGAKEHVKVLDFGLAMVADSQPQMRLTESNIIMGTPGFMSPEQIDGAGVDARSDLYALGILWWQMLVGRPPFDGDTPIKVMMAHVQQKPVPPTEARPGLVMPAIGQELLLRLLAKHPDHRPHDGAAFTSELQALDEEGWHVATALPSDGAPIKEWEDAFDSVWNPDDDITENPFTAPVQSENPFDVGGLPPDQNVGAADNDLSHFMGGLAPPEGVDPNAAFSDVQVPGAQDFPRTPAPAPAPLPAPKPSGPQMVVRADGTISRQGQETEQHFPKPEAFDPFGELELDTGSQRPKSDSALRPQSFAEHADPAESAIPAPQPDPAPQPKPAPAQKPKPHAQKPHRESSAPAPRREVSAPRSAAPKEVRRIKAPPKKTMLLAAAALFFLGIVALAVIRPPFVSSLFADFSRDDTHAGVLENVIPKWSGLRPTQASAESVFAQVKTHQKNDTQRDREVVDVLVRELLLKEPGNVQAMATLLENAMQPFDGGARFKELPVGEMEKAIATLNSPEAKRTRALLSLRRGDPLQALDSVRAQDDDFSKAIAAQSLLNSDPIQALERVAGLRTSTRSASVHAQVLYLLGRYEQAQSAIDRRLLVEPKDAQALTLKAQLQSGNQRQQNLDAALASNPKNPAALLLKSQTLSPEQRAKALAAITDTSDVSTHRALAIGAFARAASGDTKALSPLPTVDPTGVLTFTRALLSDQKQAPSLLKEAERIAGERGNNIRAANLAARLGAHALAADNTSGALAHFQRALQQDAGSLEAILGVLLVHAMNKDDNATANALLLRTDPFARARRTELVGTPPVFSKSFKEKLAKDVLKRGRPGAALVRGLWAFLDDEGDDALKELGRVRSRAETYEGASLFLAAAELQRDRGRRADRALQKIKSKSPAVDLMKARTFIALKKFDKARPLLEELRKGTGSMAVAAETGLAAIEGAANKQTGAKARLRAALAMDPSDVLARKALADFR